LKLIETRQFSFDFKKAFEKVRGHSSFLEALSHDIDSSEMLKRDIASSLDMSPSEFSRRCTKTFNSNPNDDIAALSIKDLEKLFSIIGKYDSIIWLFRKFVMEHEEAGYQQYLQLKKDIPNLDKIMNAMQKKGGIGKFLEAAIEK